MYLYRTKHKLLSLLNDECVKKRNPDARMSAEVLSKKIGGINSKKRTLQGLSSLYAHGMTEYSLASVNDWPIVGMKSQGLNAFANRDFVKLQDRLFWGIFRDCLLVLSGIAVAIATFISLNQTKELKSVQENIKELSQELRELKTESTRQASLLRVLQDSVMKK